MITDLDSLNTRSNDQNEKSLFVHKDPYEACQNSHAIAIITEWDEFFEYDWKKIYKKMMAPAKVFDGRNLIDNKKMKQIGFEFFSIGKA